MDASGLVCAQCGNANPLGMRFCGYCGSPLPSLCPACGQPVPAGMKFCGHCGSALPSHQSPPPAGPIPASQPPGPAPPSPSIQEERRLVTALFCDLVGFTPLSERLDPEEIRDIQATYFTSMSEQIERYGGTVEKYAGDAVLALFGTPVAHEDDAERAVLCALSMQAAIEPVAARVYAGWNVEPAIRIGVNTGEVVSGAWSASGRHDAAVTGDAVNTAARLQAAADPGEVLVGIETMRLTRRRIRYGPTRELTLKGKRAIVPAHAALGVREEVGERWEESPRVSPLIGRDRELAQILDAWMRAQGGEGQLLTVIGDPGVGKSRLLAETVERISAGGALRVLRARCLSYGQGISLWLVADLLRGLFGIREQDATDAVQAQLGTAVRGLLAGMDETTQAETVDVLGEVLGLPAGGSVVAQAGPQIRRQALLRSVRHLLGALAARSPTVLVLEDLHWIDAASEEVLVGVLGDVPGLRLLVLAAQRPGWMAPWSEWGWTERLTLRPLRPEEATAMAGAVLGKARLSPGLDRYVAERAAGNPFFVEEMLRALEESGGLVQRNGAMDLAAEAAKHLPSTLTEILLARLDRLEEQVRTVAQVASVIGRNFAVRLLAQVMEREQRELEVPLAALQRAEIAFPRHAADPEYVFKHVSMRDAAYNTLVTRRRQQLHLKTARAIGALYPVDEYVEMIAYHYGRTDEHAEAVPWLERAGDRAAAVYATESALNHYQDAISRLGVVGTDPLAIARVEEKLGVALQTAGHYPDALRVLQRSIDKYRELHDLEAEGRAAASMAMCHASVGTLEDGIALVLLALDLLAGSGPSPAHASLLNALAGLYSMSGRYSQIGDVAERAEQIARSIGNQRLLGEAEERRAGALGMLGKLDDGLQMLQRAIPLIEAGGDLVVLCRALNNAGFVCERLGRMEECSRYGERALAVAERVGNPHETAFMLANLGSLSITLGDWHAARNRLERAMALLEGERSAYLAGPLGYLGQLALYEGRWAEAEHTLRELLEVVQQTGERQLLEGGAAFLAELAVLEGRPEEAIELLDGLAATDNAELLIFPPLAWAYLEAGAVDRAREVIGGAVQRARAEGQRVLLPETLRVHGMVLVRQELAEEAKATFIEGLRLARSLPFPYVEGRILYELGRLEQRQGHTAEGRQRLEEACDIFRRLGARKDDARAEQALAQLART